MENQEKRFNQGTEHDKLLIINGIVKQGLEGVSLEFANELLEKNPDITYDEMMSRVGQLFAEIEKFAPNEEGRTMADILGASNWYEAFWKDKIIKKHA